MAQRPVFRPGREGERLVDTTYVSFLWHPGMSSKQKQKSVAELHLAACQQTSACSPLEISTKSTDPLGVQLSAFNLEFTTLKYGMTMSVESAFQGSKVFESGGPYTDLYDADSRSAKRDPRLRSSGRLTKFKFFGKEWSLQPVTAFYDWLYINALIKNIHLVDRLDEFDSFTDIEFNPDKSLNCQARSVALFVSLRRRGIRYERPISQNEFLAIVGASGSQKGNMQLLSAE